MADTYTFVPGETADRIPTKLQVGLIDTGNTVNGQPIYAMQVDTANAHAPAQETLTDGATITWAFGNDRVRFATVTLGGNRTLAITGAVSGTSGILKVVQDGSGGHTLALPANSYVVNGGAGVVTLSAGAGDIDILSFFYDGTNYYWTVGLDFTAA